jgi:hypothetical protein
MSNTNFSFGDTKSAFSFDRDKETDFDFGSNKGNGFNFGNNILPTWVTTSGLILENEPMFKALRQDYMANKYGEGDEEGEEEEVQMEEKNVHKSRIDEVAELKKKVAAMEKNMIDLMKMCNSLQVKLNVLSEKLSSK